MLKSANAAGAIDFDNLGLDLAGNLGERRRAVAGPRDACPGEEAGDCSRNGADVFPIFGIANCGLRIGRKNPRSEIRNPKFNSARRHYCFVSFAAGFLPADQSYDEILMSANMSSPWRMVQWKGRERPSTWRMSSKWISHGSSSSAIRNSTPVQSPLLGSK